MEARKRETGYELLGESEADLLAKLVHHVVLGEIRTMSANHGGD